MSKAGPDQTATTTTNNAPPAYVQAAQQNLLNTGQNLAAPFTQDAPAFGVAGFNPDQTAAFDLARTSAQSAYTTPQVTPNATAVQNDIIWAPERIAAQAMFAGPSSTATAQQTGPGSQASASLAGPSAQANPLLSGPSAQANATQTGPASLANASLFSSPAAQATTRDAIAAQTDPNAYQSFLNPYTRDVVNTTNDELRRQHGITQAGISANMASGAAFGGSREGVRAGEADRAFLDKSGQITAQLMSQGYDKAVAQAMADTQLRQQAGLQNSQLGTQTSQFNANQANDIGKLNAQLGTQTSQFNAGQGNDISKLNAQLGTNVNLNNAQRADAVGALNSQLGTNVNLNNAQRTDAVNALNSQLGTQTSQFNTGQDNDLAKLNAQLGTNVNLNNSQRADAINLANSQLGTNTNVNNATRQDQAWQFNANLGTNVQRDNATRQDATDKFNATFNNQSLNDQQRREMTALQALLGTGAQQQQTAQQSLNLPADWLQRLQQITPTTTGSLSQGQTTTPTQTNVLGTAAGLLTALKGIGIFSDENEKTDVKKLGKDPQTGIEMAAYRYRGDPKTYPKVVGPASAQQVERVQPGATRKIGGKMVVKTNALRAMMGS